MNRIPWFMHCHHRHGNTQVGVFGTSYGTYVRSWRDGEVDVQFYPMHPATRVVTQIGLFTHKSSVTNMEDEITRAVIEHMNSFV